jgi:hypothetical protein
MIYDYYVGKLVLFPSKEVQNLVVFVRRTIILSGQNKDLFCRSKQYLSAPETINFAKVWRNILKGVINVG